MPSTPLLARAIGAGAAAITTAAARAAAPVLADRLPGGRERWDRTNHRGETVTLLEGPVAAVGTAAGILCTPGLDRATRTAGALVALGAGALGALDDLSGSGADRGLRGHLQALREGRVTTGAVKVAGLGVTGWLAARSVGHRGVDALVSGAVVAGFANVVNLLDLRPGRALKVVAAHGLPALVLPQRGAATLAAPVGAAVAALPDDLAERSMLGDTGANALGAAVGLATIVSYGRLGRAAHLVGLAAVTLASERVSFTELIAATPVLRRLDELGRRPVDAA